MLISQPVIGQNYDDIWMCGSERVPTKFGGTAPIGGATTGAQSHPLNPENQLNEMNEQE